MQCRDAAIRRAGDMKLSALNTVVGQYALEEFGDDSRSILEEQLPVRCGGCDDEVAAPFSLPCGSCG